MYLLTRRRRRRPDELAAESVLAAYRLAGGDDVVDFLPAGEHLGLLILAHSRILDRYFGRPATEALNSFLATPDPRLPEVLIFKSRPGAKASTPQPIEIPRQLFERRTGLPENDSYLVRIAPAIPGTEPFPHINIARRAKDRRANRAAGLERVAYFADERLFDQAHLRGLARLLGMSILKDSTLVGRSLQV